MNGNDIRRDDYPHNLMLALKIMPAADEDTYKKQKEGLEYVLSSVSLRDSEREVLHYRFEEKKTLSEVAKITSKTPERIRQIESVVLRKLRHPVRSNIIAYGIEAAKTYEEGKVRIAEAEENVKALQEIYKHLKDDIESTGTNIEKEAEKEVTIEALYLFPNRLLREGKTTMSTRTYNVLKKNGIATLRSLSEMTKEEIKRLSSMGAKSYEEILVILKEHDITLKSEENI